MMQPTEKRVAELPSVYEAFNVDVPETPYNLNRGSVHD